MTLIERQNRNKVIARCQSDANAPKHRLIELIQNLEDAGAYRQAQSLGTIIEKLEKWQNK